MNARSFRRSFRRSGFSVLGLLVVLATMLLGFFWGYRQFLENYHLKNAGTMQTVGKEPNREAELAYSRKMREQHYNAMGQIRMDLDRFFAETIRGHKYAGDSNAFEQRYQELVAELRNHIEEFDQLTVPLNLNPAHTRIAHSHRVFFDSLLLLRSAFYQEKTEQAKGYQQARLTLARGWKEDLEGEQMARAILSNP